MFEAIVIGGGFAGLSATMYLARARRRVLLVDAGEPRNRFTDASHGFLGMDGKSPAAIRTAGRAELAAYDTVSFFDGQAVDARQEEDGFTITMSDGRTEQARRLVLATGVADILPEVDGVAERWGKSVLHCPFCHGYEFRDQPLGVLATGPASVHQGDLIPDWGPTTYFTQGSSSLRQRNCSDLPRAASPSSARRWSSCWATRRISRRHVLPTGGRYRLPPSTLRQS
jgi:thioredoxin reductase